MSTLGDSVGDLVFAAIADARDMADSLNPMVAMSQKNHIITKNKLERIQFTLRSTATVLANVFEEHEKLVERIEEAVAKHQQKQLGEDQKED